MNWEMIGWIAIAASLAVIFASFFMGKDHVQTASGQKIAVSDGLPTTMSTMLEIAWPVLFIATMAMLTFKEIMGFAAVLLTATVITGLAWLTDSLFFKKRRAAGVHDPVLVEMAKSFFPVILIVFLLRSFLYEPFKIPSGSMEPTLLVGDFILVNKYTYGIRIPVINKKIADIGDPKRGDVMVFRYPPEPSKDYIKRVIGLPGDTIEYSAKHLTVNGKPIAVEKTGTFTSADSNMRYFETYKEALGDKPHTMMLDPTYPSIRLGDVKQFANKNKCTYSNEAMICKVPDGHYLMMGDSRDNSEDGRYWGFVPQENIVGKAVLVWMNFGHFNRVGTAIE